jgi:hypothetical protein
MSTRVVQLIACDEVRRGNGTEDDPVRLIRRLLTLDGRVIVEWDPLGTPYISDDIQQVCSHDH